MRTWGPSHIPQLYNDIKSKTRFLHVFKNAGTTIAHAVEDRGGTILDWNLAYNNTIVKGEAQPLDSLFADPTWLRVAFIRPPVQRVLSSFNEELVRARIFYNDSDTTTIKSRDNIMAAFVQLVDEMNFTNPTSPQNRKSRIIADGIHFLTQTNFMIDKNGNKLPIDYIGDMTNLLPEMRHILQDPELEIENNSGPEDKNTYYRYSKDRKDSVVKIEDIPERTMKKLCQVYKDDFCCFGYEIPSVCDIAC